MNRRISFEFKHKINYNIKFYGDAVWPNEYHIDWTNSLLIKSREREDSYKRE